MQGFTYRYYQKYANYIVTVFDQIHNIETKPLQTYEQDN